MEKGMNVAFCKVLATATLGSILKAPCKVQISQPKKFLSKKLIKKGC
jgi:hypothetical protein